MALAAFQRDVCRLLADNRIRSGESYVPGGAALNELLRAPRRSRDLDLFHDTEEALAVSWRADRESLERTGCSASPWAIARSTARRVSSPTTLPRSTTG